MSLYRLSFNRHGTIHSWKKWHGVRGWKPATDMEFGFGGGGSTSKDWPLKDHAIMFQAHHWSSILKGLANIGSKNRIAFPNDRVDIDHQYWINKKRQGLEFSYVGLKGGIHHSINEKSNHVHKVIIYKTGSIGQLGPKGRATKLFSFQVQGWKTCGQIAQMLSTQGSKIGKAPSVTGDVIEEIISQASTIGEFFTP